MFISKKLLRIISRICLISCLAGYSHWAAATFSEDVDRGASQLQAVIPDVHEKILQIPADQVSDAAPVMLQVTVYTPDDTSGHARRFPMVVINHGNADMPPRDQPRSRLSYASLYFLSRGYAVVQPMMRGYAGSGGQQNISGCDVVSDNMNNAFDIRQVIAYMSTQPYIDGSRVLVAGQSFGGFNTLAVGTLDIPSVKGLINFNGGSGIKKCPDGVDHMVDTAGYFAARTKIPSLWFYGTNDKIIAESTWQAAYRRYNLLGGNARLVPLGNFKDDSHNFIGYEESVAFMTPPLDAFLQQVGLPSAITYPAFIPPPLQASSHFADINDVNAVPISPAARAQYQKFLALPLPRVFFIGQNGLTIVSGGGINPLDRGLQNCAQQHIQCWPYAVDNEVVWVRPSTLIPIPPPSHFADIQDVNAVPINSAARAQYQKFLSLSSPRVFLIAQNGATLISSGSVDILDHALASCQQQHLICAPYAVDNQVVWSPTQDFLKPSHFADIHDLEAIPYLDATGRKTYQKFLTAHEPRAFVIAPDGAAFMGTGNTALQIATTACALKHEGCSAYAFNDDVVWTVHQ